MGQVFARSIAGLALVAATLLSAPVTAGRLGGIEVAAQGASADVVIRFKGNGSAPASFALDEPKRLVVDLPGVTVSTVGAASGGPVAKVRAAQFDASTTRIVLDLSGPARIALNEAIEGGIRLKISPTDEGAYAKLVAAGRSRLAVKAPAPEIAQAPPQPKVTKPEAAPSQIAKAEVAPPKPVAQPQVAKAAPPKTATATPVKLAAAPPPPTVRERRRTGLPVVVIDAGHGGKDVGTISVLGNTKYEKDAVLAIAKAIKKELDASGTVRAILTRSDDRFLRLPDRFGIARRNRADLFISIHADSAPSPQASGATVYTLSETASDAEAARLAAKENRSDIINGVDLGVETSEVTDILIDLAQRETMNRSSEFAALLQRELREDIKVRSQFHRFAGFVVLKAPDVPSVLLETGYLSNEEDSKFLFSPAGQARIAKGVRRAVEGHFLRRIAQR